MRKTYLAAACATAAALLLASCGGGGGDEAPVEMNVLGNRADLVSAGQALVEVKFPTGTGATPANLKVLLNGADVTSAFAVRANGRYMGLVEGLKEGENKLVARSPNGGAAHLVIRNHPNGGPIISGAQVGPWVCTTKVAAPTANNPDLGNPLDDK